MTDSCKQCGRPFEQTGIGRPRLYCRAEHRQQETSRRLKALNRLVRDTLNDLGITSK